MDITYVKAVFGSLRKTRTKAIFRDDHDLILQLVGVKDLPTYFQAHFANTEYGTAVVMMGSDGEVSIPNTLLATGLPVYCWILVEQGISGAVRYSVQIPVRQKARPDGTIPQPQADIISQAISALNDAGANAQEAADSAAQSAEYVAGVKDDLYEAIDRVGVLEEAKEATLEAAGNAEAWAVGNRGGSAVPSTDQTYHNNAKYYAEQAAESARTLTTDDTLTKSGQAADAKKTGDEIAGLKEDLSINDPPTVTWQIGGFTSNGAINSTYKYAIRNSGGTAITITKDGTIGCASGYRIKVVKYSGINMGAGTFLSNSGWVTAPIAVSTGDYVGISIMYGTDTSVVLDDTSISANVILTFRTLKIADNSIAQTKLTTDIQSLLADTASAIPQVASNTSDIATIAEWVDLPTNIAYVTDGVFATHYGVTYVKSANNALSLYGTSSGLGFFNIFNGADGYGNSGSSTPAKNLTAGTYIVDFDGTESNKLEVCYTDSTYSNRTVLRSGQILVVADGGGAIFARIYGSKNFGTEESPTVLKLSMRNVSYNHGPYNVYGRDFSEWYSGLNGDYSLYGFGWGTKYADVIALYDALVTAYPDYITKTALGQGSGTDSQGDAYNLFEYAFVPKIKASGLNTRKTPKILMDACIHGFEKNSALGLFCPAPCGRVD